MDLDTIIRAVQGSPKVNVKVDGRAGIATWTAIYKAIIGESSTPPIVVTGGTVDPRSEQNIGVLHPRVQPYARTLVQKAAAAGITIKVISGLRSYAEQSALYLQPHDGKDNDGDGRVDEADEQVTKAPAGHSNHNFGLAFDIGIFDGPKYIANSPLYKAVATIGLDLGLEWGGNWKSPIDEPHYQLRPAWAKSMSESLMLAELRRLKDSGRDFFA